MSFMIKLIKRLERRTPKDFVVAGAFTLALFGAIGLGLASRQLTSATASRDCSQNSIDFQDLNGGCGAANPAELVADARSNNPNDLQTIYSYFGLTPDKYDQFASTAQQGEVRRDGTVTVSGQVVMTNVFTMGRDKFNSHRMPIVIGGKTYYQSAPQYSFATGVDAIPAMVMFDNSGVAQTAIMNPCGNTIGGHSVTNSVTCKALSASQPDQIHKPNTYDFTTSADVAGNAVITRVVYHFSDDNSTVTKSNLTDAVEHTFTKDANVTVTVFASVPGGHEIQSVAVVNCEKNITFVPPFFVCSNLAATAIDDQKKSFRFTVMVKTDTTGATTLRDVDFILDGKGTTSGVTTKDAQGNVYKEYTFTDDVQHTVKASVNFNTAEGVQSVACQASVTPAKTPMCTVPGHTTEAPNSPTCGYCQPNIPIGDTRCTPPPTPTPPTTPAALINTGPGSSIGLFGATAIVGFFGHKLFMSRRARRMASEVAPVL
jgi:hypothetical protein